jgi:hypothetical protein
LLGDHLHVASHVLNLSLLLHLLVLQLLLLLHKVLPILHCLLKLGIAGLEHLLLALRFGFKLLRPAHFKFKCFPQLRLGLGVLPVLIFKVADFFVYLPQLML